MGKAQKTSGGTSGSQPATKADAAAKPKASKSKAVASAAPEVSILGRLRPRPRFIFFPVFVALCLGLVALHDQCDVKGKKKDCGYSGITPGACKTFACFLKGGKGFETRKIKVDVEQDASLGLAVRRDGEGGRGALIVTDVQEGAVRLHNSQAGAEDVLQPGDELQRVAGDGRTATKPKDMEKALERTGTGRAVELEVRRSRLAPQLQWLHSTSGKPNFPEKVLSAPGTQHMLKVWSQLGGIGFASWLISGYSPASLPMYGLISAATAFELSRCCHNEQVGGGVPHCYRSKRDHFGAVLHKAVQRTNSTAQRVVADGRGYAKWLMVPTPLKL